MKKTVLSIAITIIALNILAINYIRDYDYNFSSLIRLSETTKETHAPEYFQKGMVVFKEGGYDGQFYYFAAVDPFLQRGLFKNPFRMQRILYPLAANALAGGNADYLPFTMYLVNIVSIGAAVYFLCLILMHFSANPLWSLLFGLSPPSIMAVMYDLPSALSIALILAAVYYYIKDKTWHTSVFFMLAFLCREDTIMTVAPLVALDLWRKKSLKSTAILAASLIPFFAWQAFIRMKTGSLPTGASAAVAISPIPLYGIIGYVKTLSCVSFVQVMRSLSTVAVFAYFIAAGLSVIRPLLRERHLFFFIVAAFSALTAFTVPYQWTDYNGVFRMFYGLIPFLILSSAVSKDRFVGYVAYATAFFSIATVIGILFLTPSYPYFLW